MAKGEPHHEERVASDRPRHDHDWRFRVAVPLAFFVAGIILYSVYLGHPDEVVFDEVHYLTAARNFADAQWMNPDWSDDRPWNWEHPPLAKYWMGLTIQVFGDEDPSHYRLPSVVYGAAGLAGISVLARRVFASNVAAVVAPLLLMASPMWFVHSRLAILEIFVAAPMVWAFAFAFGDEKWEPWAAVGAASLALAAKYTALFLFPMLFLILLWRRVGMTPTGLFGPREVARAFAMVFLVPIGFVLLTWAPFLKVWATDQGFAYAIEHTWYLFKHSLTWGSEGPTEHPEASPPLHWLLMLRPTWYWVHWGEGSGLEQTVGTIYAIGNPVIWWGGLLLGAIVFLPAALRLLGALRTARLQKTTWRVDVRRADWRVLGTLGVAFLVFGLGYLPFFLLSRIAFLYYMTLLVPYLVLIATGALVWFLHRTAENEEERLHAEAAGWPEPARKALDQEAPVWHRVRTWWDRVAADAWTGRALLGGFVLLSIALAIYWIPLYTGIEVQRVWIERGWDVVPWMRRLIADV